MYIVRISFVIIGLVIIGSCAGEVVLHPSYLSPASSSDRSRITISQEASIRLSTGYKRTLPAGSIWELRGNLPYGGAYKRVNGIFTVEGAHVHEAFIVIHGNRLVGFYLPVEQAYARTEVVLLTID